MNLIKNNKVTKADINLAKKSYGTAFAKIKRKTKRSRPIPVLRKVVEIPEELMEVQQHLTVSMDGLTVTSLNFLSTISHELYYSTSQYVTKTVASV